MNSTIHPPESISLNSIQASLNLDSLGNRRRYLDIYFLSKLVNGVISCLELLQLINLNVPDFRSRSYPTFKIPFRRTARECNNLKNFDVFNIINLHYLNLVFFNWM